ncbi:conserved protein of unknown function [Paraburkholderia dioscoreae]|uniref:Uncharacterized protein n=1 Tax=Paraburkholderia dioscoreae TaxID=2604047 RepID=A0A5Q4ZIQ6_9BURK|nr:conserved protein of unknown function [Paraburkholderia dioscoreae]
MRRPDARRGRQRAVGRQREDELVAMHSRGLNAVGERHGWAHVGRVEQAVAQHGGNVVHRHLADRNVDARMRASKSAHVPLQHARISRRRDVADFDPPEFAALGQHRALFAAREVIERDARLGEIRAARRAQRHRALGAMEEPHAEQPFSLLNQLGQRRRGDPQFFGGAREMKLFRDADESMDMAEFELPHDFCISNKLIIL